MIGGPGSRTEIVDKRSGRGKTDFTTDKTYEKNRNRLSNVRYPLGEEPGVDVPGTDGYIGARHVDSSEVDESKWVNVKYEVVEGADLEPNQKDKLQLGPEINMKCHICQKPLRIAAEADAKKVLEAGGFKFDPFRIYNGLNKKVVITACEAGHTQQWNEDFVRGLIKHG